MRKEVENCPVCGGSKAGISMFVDFTIGEVGAAQLYCYSCGRYGPYFVPEDGKFNLNLMPELMRIWRGHIAELMDCGYENK